MKIITKEMVQEKIKERFPNEPFEIIEYTYVTKTFTIKCLTCGKITIYSNYNNFINSGTHLCNCLGRNPILKRKKDNEDKILALINNIESQSFIGFGKREKTKKLTVNVFCKKCSQTFEKTYQDYILNQLCPFCESNHNMNHKSFLLRLPSDYEALEEYAGMDTKILMRHSCGFIRKMTPHNLLAGHTRCPHCGPTYSKGEQKIVEVLTKLNISYEHERHFTWAINNRIRYDFYVPLYNLIIEYHGEQHYKDTPYFHRKFSLEQQKERDLQKKNDAISNGFNYLVIPYTDFHNIEQILTTWFNDYPARE